MVVTQGEADLRALYIDGAVKAVALAEYKLKNLCTISTTNAWTNKYYRETNDEFTQYSGNAVAGVARGADFPYHEVSETLVSGVLVKYADSGRILHEDEITDNLPMVQRTILKVGRSIAYQIDKAIAAAMLANAGNTYAITATYEWDSATEANQRPVFDILSAIDLIKKDNINPLNGSGYLCLNGTDYLNLITNSKLLNHPTYTSVSAVENGVVGTIAGLKILVTEALEATTPDVAYVVVANEAMTYKEAEALQVEQINDPGIARTIRAWGIGQIQVTAPNAIAKITNTRK